MDSFLFFYFGNESDDDDDDDDEMMMWRRKQNDFVSSERCNMKKSFHSWSWPRKSLSRSVFDHWCYLVKSWPVTWPMPCHSQCIIRHRPLVSIQLYLVLLPPSVFSCTWILPYFLLQIPFPGCYWVALFLCCLVMLALVPAWQCNHHFFLWNNISRFFARPWPWPNDLRIWTWPYALKIYQMSENKLCISRLSTVIIWQTDRYDLNYYHSRFVGS